MQILPRRIDLEFSSSWLPDGTHSSGLNEFAYVPSPSHRALDLYKQNLKSLCAGEDMPGLLFFMLAMLNGRQQEFDGSALVICFLEVD